MGTFAALCMGVALSGSVATMRELGFVGRYKSSLVTSICKANTTILAIVVPCILLTELMK